MSYYGVTRASAWLWFAVTWRGEKSGDGKTWSGFMVVEAHRSKE